MSIFTGDILQGTTDDGLRTADDGLGFQAAEQLHATPTDTVPT
jgi:hypothetical protein